jgi:D-glycero-D-manno-heptose 1,7-bisphosphate phosphatase
MPRAVFLDRDNTLVYDSGYTHRVDDLQLLPGVAEGLAQLQAEGFMLFIVTNQSGIGRGLYTVEQFQAFQRALDVELGQYGVTIRKSYFCPHLPEDGCACRKPRTGLLLEARAEYGIDLAASWVIGDRVTDVELAHNAGARGALVGPHVETDTISDVAGARFGDVVRGILETEAAR